MSGINEISATVKRVMGLYGVNLSENEHGINNEGFAIIMATELFKELRGIGKPVPARRPATTKTEKPIKLEEKTTPILAQEVAKFNIGKKELA